MYLLTKNNTVYQITSSQSDFFLVRPIHTTYDEALENNQIFQIQNSNVKEIDSNLHYLYLKSKQQKVSNRELH